MWDGGLYILAWGGQTVRYLQFEICLLILCNHLTQENSFDIFLQFSINPLSDILIIVLWLQEKMETPDPHKNPTEITI